LNHIRRKKGLKECNGEDPYQATKDYSIEKLANIVEENLDMDYIDSLLFDN
jgi:adenosylcobyric acid synthase